jgi:D-alanyl-D-alanine carboxypeptidase (penicillin-binding protein 5/6)
MHSEKNIRIGFITVLAGIIAVSAWLFFRSSDEGPEPVDEPVKTPRETVSQPQIKTNRNTYYLPARWTYKNGVVADALPLKNVSQIPSGILVDANTGNILWSKRSRQGQKIASMTKMMTMLLAMVAVKDGKIRLDDKITVSATASRIGGSQVFLKQGEVFTLEELLKSIIIVSANDSSHLVAEAIAGDVESFVGMMNKKAKELGMANTTFYNPHGLPLNGKHNTSTALDMAILARELLKHPDVLDWSATWMDTFRNGEFQMVNHNKLVNPATGVKGVDGLKTGYYKKAGFCVTATALRDRRRMIAVIIGAEKKTVRNAFAKELLEWGYLQPKM